MKGSLPTRENVLPLLSDIVRKKGTGKFFDTAAPRPHADCGSCVLPQERILKEEFAIRYPTINKQPRELFPSGSSSTVGSMQEVDDFKLAVELQYAENQAKNMSFGTEYCIKGNKCHNPADSMLDNSSEDDMDGTNNAATALLSLNNINSVSH
ncbi:Hypothetical predicted protein [Paramuricea clavata]|uniref:Uncharacterized protein n=1 Tax=Paramuricea clavata TaxID=317549 RepID=A0A6S7HJ90_PARCT|nr:Hypothetical predicted protein [Paramuricea clavata]